MSKSSGVVNVNLGAICCDLGITGPTGITGATGLQGSPGLPGTQGSQGPRGATGAPGAQGAQGSSGVGLQGNQGSQGSVGSIGLQGIQGNQGVQGAMGSGAGAQGFQGFQGSSGLGFQGAQGFQGAPGMPQIAYGLIYRENPIENGRFRAGADSPLLIESQNGFAVPCDLSTTWNNFQVRNISLITDSNSLPVQFEISLSGLYYFSYSLSFSSDLGGGSQEYRFTCQVGSTLIPGSETLVTASTDGTVYHVSHVFLVSLTSGNQIGVYANAVGNSGAICTEMYDGSFTCHLLDQLIIS